MYSYILSMVWAVISWTAPLTDRGFTVTSWIKEPNHRPVVLGYIRIRSSWPWSSKWWQERQNINNLRSLWNTQGKHSWKKWPKKFFLLPSWCYFIAAKPPKFDQVVHGALSFGVLNMKGQRVIIWNFLSSRRQKHWKSEKQKKN